MAGSGYHRLELRDVAEAKIADAILLADNLRFSNAYYLAGYSVEIALKACIARQFKPETLPDRRFVNAVHTHDFDELIRLAGLQDDSRAAFGLDPMLGANWAIVAEWSEATRYDMVTREKCDQMIEAVGGEPSGVLQWLRQHW
jgi:hypothetical protein